MNGRIGRRNPNEPCIEVVRWHCSDDSCYAISQPDSPQLGVQLEVVALSASQTCCCNMPWGTWLHRLATDWLAVLSGLANHFKWDTRSFCLICSLDLVRWKFLVTVPFFNRVLTELAETSQGDLHMAHGSEIRTETDITTGKTYSKAGQRVQHNHRSHSKAGQNQITTMLASS